MKLSPSSILIVIILIVVLLLSETAQALTMSTSKNTLIDCGQSVWGCYHYNNDNIFIDENLTGNLFFTVFIHEIGHRLYGESQTLASNYEKKIAEDLLSVKIYKLYIKYIDQPEIYEYATGRHIEYEEAVKENIWNDVQELPFRNRILFKNEYEQLNR